MDSKDIDRAMRYRLPVVFDGVRYERIVEYISFYDDLGRRRLSCGLVEKNFYMRVPAEKVEFAETNAMDGVRDVKI